MGKGNAVTTGHFHWQDAQAGHWQAGMPLGDQCFTSVPKLWQSHALNVQMPGPPVRQGFWRTAPSSCRMTPVAGQRNTMRARDVTPASVIAVMNQEHGDQLHEAPLRLSPEADLKAPVTARCNRSRI